MRMRMSQIPLNFALSEGDYLVTYPSSVAGSFRGAGITASNFLSGWMGSGHNNIKQQSRVPRDALTKFGVITKGKQLA